MVSISKILTKIFGSRNDRLLKRYRTTVAKVNEFEPQVRALTDEQLRDRTQELRKGIAAGELAAEDVLVEGLAIIRESMDRNIGIRQIFNPEENFNPDQLDDAMLQVYDDVQKKLQQPGETWTRISIPVPLYEAVRKLYPESRPPFRARCFDVQLIGGLVLYEGKIAEMATGEGKTFVAPLAFFLRALQGMHCHVVTVNDYLVRRDADWVRPAFENLGVSIGYIQSSMDPGGEIRRKAYECNITYGTNSEFGFDYLRDNMKERVDLQVQGPLDFAIVDEVDSILIDEARTPLIISGGAHDDAPKYRAADEVARKVIELHRPWAEVERKIDACKRAIKGAEGDMDKAGGDKAKIDEIQKRKEKAEAEMAELEAKKKGLTQYYEVELDRKSAHLTHDGIAAAQDFAGVGSFYVGNNMEWPHLMEQSMRAHVVYEKDKDYVVERGARSGELEVIIVDEYTGRKMEGRQWSDGLHQAVEAKERVPIKQETQTLATITLQNFFKLYKALAGMTGTAMTEAEEFTKIYRLEVVTIPTNRPVIRRDHDDRVYRTEEEKWNSIVEEIKRTSDAGRPVLVGTTSVEKSEMLSNRLMRRYGVEHEVLNAKHHEREASIVAKAGQSHKNVHEEIVGNVTIATNMAGRGTDIKLAPETLFDVTAEADGDAFKYTLIQRGTGKKIEVKEGDELMDVYQLSPGTSVCGGLHVIGTERHTARRIDNQLRGRSGRQGDPGSSRFYVSLQDELMKMFAGDWVIRVLGWLGMEEGQHIEDKRITKGILRAQKKVEERNFLARKNLLDYDEVMDYQRTTFYGLRQKVLEGRDIADVIWDMIGDSITDAVDKYITQDYLANVLSEWVKTEFQVSIDAHDLRGMHTVEELEPYIKDQARADAMTTITSTLDEFMGDDDEEEEEDEERAKRADPSKNWDVRGLSSWAMSRFRVNLPVSQIKKMTKEEVEERLREAAIEQIDKHDCAGLLKYLDPLFAEGELAAWARDKFRVQIEAKDLLEADARTRKPSEEMVQIIEERARAAYARREIEYPIDHVLQFAFGGEDGNTDNPYAADFVRNWIKDKFTADVSIDHIRGLSVRSLRDELIGFQEKALESAAIEAIVDQLMSENSDPDKLVGAVNDRYGARLTERDLQPPPALSDGDEEIVVSPREIVTKSVRQFFRRELTMLEQYVLISILDQSWKDHLYAMDILRSSVGLMGFAERDPRIVFKKEGFRYFEEMIQGVRDKVTDLIFRAALTAQTQTRSVYRETAAVHEESGGYGVGENLARTGSAQAATPDGEAQASGGGEDGARVKQIVNVGPKVGRNDPCPCGSGKKYKKCCGKNVA